MNKTLVVIEGTVVCTIGSSTFVSNELSDSQVKTVIDIVNSDKPVDTLEISRIFNPKVEQILLENENVQKTIHFLEDHPHLFTRKGNSWYRNGIDISLPQTLVEKYISLLNEGESIDALDNFWIKSALNPDPQARHDLFAFLKKYGFDITTSGHFIAYRNVNIKNEGNKELHDFVVSSYFKVKKWKKSPKNYEVYKDEAGKYQYAKKGEYIGVSNGNLYELYQNISDISETVYTDAHTGKMNIRIGQPVPIDRSKCDPDPKRTCSRGLHVAGASWLTASYYGTQGIICLINPMHVVAVPHADNYGKMRVCEYLPYSLVERDSEGNIIQPSETLEEFYEDYTIEKINELLDLTEFEEFQINELTVKSVGEVHGVYLEITEELYKVKENRNKNIYG